MKSGIRSSRPVGRGPARPDAAQIPAQRELLDLNYYRLVGELRSHRRAVALYARNPSLAAQELVGLHRRRLNAALGRYLQTLAKLRHAVEAVFSAGTSGPNMRRPPKRPRP